MESKTIILETSSDSSIDSELTTIESNNKTKYLDEHKLLFVSSHRNLNMIDLNIDKLCNFKEQNNKFKFFLTNKEKKVTFKVELNEVFEIPSCEKYNRKKKKNRDQIIKEGTVDKECFCPIF